jgi:hypothetical protein
MYMSFSMLTRMGIWIDEGQLIGMCSICLGEKLVGVTNRWS